MTNYTFPEVSIVGQIPASPGLPQLPASPTIPGANSPGSGSLPDNNPSSSNTNFISDQLANLLETKFDGIAFPTTSFKESGSHDLAIHKYPNLDVARLENTGRNSSVYSLRAIFTNNIYPSQNESWTQGLLFPTTFNKVLASLYDTNTPIKTMIHPYLGSINVMVQSWNYEFTGDHVRDGAYIDIIFMETQTFTNITQSIVPAFSPMASLTQSAGALDALLAPAKYPVAPHGLSLSGFFSAVAGTIRNAMAIPGQIINSINAPISQIGIGLNQIASATQFYQAGSTQYVASGSTFNLIGGVNSGQPNTPVYSYQALQNVYSASFALNQNTQNNANQLLSSAQNFVSALITYYSSMSSIDTAQIKLNLYLMLGQLQQIQQTQFSNSNNWSIQQYIPQTTTTLIQLSNLLNNTIDQLISLNPTLNKTLFIQAFSPVSYYQA